MNETKTPIHAELWRTIAAFEIDSDPVDLTFEARLARENGWTLPFARRVALEYKKFVFLAMTAGHPVTPSDQVDQAWHLHLTYTQSYWERLCSATLPRPLHHNPTRGGSDEDTKFHDWYTRTKESYQRFFGAAPPEDIWPEACIRFGDDLHFQRINTLHHWVIPKERTRRALRRAAIVGLPTLTLAGCTPLLLGHAGTGLTPGLITFLVVAGVLFLVLIIIAWKRGGCGSGTGCSAGTGCGFGAAGHSGSGCGSSGSGDAGSGCGSSGCGSGCGGGGCGGGGCGS